jgi:DNA-binding MarR family transcriptional regulator
VAETAGAAQRHELLARMRDVLKAIRLFKNRQPPQQMLVPSGTFGVMAVIDTTPETRGCHVKDLAAQCALDPSTVSRAVGSLVRAGLVHRTADPVDGRASVLALTEHGRRTLTDVTGWYDDLLADALRDWSAEDLSAFAAMLQRFSDDLIQRTHSTSPSTSPSTSLEAAR